MVIGRTHMPEKWQIKPSYWREEPRSMAVATPKILLARSQRMTRCLLPDRPNFTAWEVKKGTKRARAFWIRIGRETATIFSILCGYALTTDRFMPNMGGWRSRNEKRLRQSQWRICPEPSRQTKSGHFLFNGFYFQWNAKYVKMISVDLADLRH